MTDTVVTKPDLALVIDRPLTKEDLACACMTVQDAKTEERIKLREQEVNFVAYQMYQAFWTLMGMTGLCARKGVDAAAATFVTMLEAASHAMQGWMNVDKSFFDDPENRRKAIQGALNTLDVAVELARERLLAKLSEVEGASQTKQ